MCDAGASGGVFRKLEDVYAGMDRAYAKVAARYGFSCNGCFDNCCRTRFYHHTALECAYLVSGFSLLSRQMRNQCLVRAEAYHREMETVISAGESFRHMCPVNEGGLCLLYAYRPMICRLHGIPHELSPPGRAKIFGAGCRSFEVQCGGMPYLSFDRTPFYTRMADLERSFREYAAPPGKVKMTVAQMLLATQKGVP